MFPCLARLALLCLLAAAPALAADPPAPPPPGPEAAAPPARIAVDAARPSDAAIETRLRAILAEIAGFSRVGVTAQAGVVLLRGEVAAEERIAEAEAIARRVDGVVTVRNEIELAASVGEILDPAVLRIERRLRQAAGLLPLILVAFLATVLIAGAGFWIARRERLWHRLTPNAFLRDLYRQVARLAFLVVAFVVGLDILGASALIGTILGAAGIVGLAVGFAVRDTVENYIASIMLSLRQPFHPNDLVSIGGREGHVMHLTSRATVLMTLDGNHLRIPNAEVFKATILNYTRNPERRFDFRLGVEAGTDPNRAIALGLEALGGLSFVLADPPPEAWLEEVGESNLVIWYGAWVDQNAANFPKSRGEAIRAVKRALEAEGIGLPEPIYRVLLQSEAAAAADAAAPAAEAAAPPPRLAQMETRTQSAVARKVREERTRPKSDDLLDPAAPQEM